MRSLRDELVYAEPLPLGHVLLNVLTAIHDCMLPSLLWRSPGLVVLPQQ
jgi:hypothetical protein